MHQAVLAHRQWFEATVTDQFALIRKDDAEAAGRHFVMLRDGAMAAGCLSDADAVCETFLRGVEGLLRVFTAEAEA